MLRYNHIADRLVFALLLQSARAMRKPAKRQPSPYFRVERHSMCPSSTRWEDQSSADTVAQFHLAEAGATIRTAVVPQDDILAAAGADLSAAVGVDFGAPIYQDKVNLADGTWTVLLYESDAGVSASVHGAPCRERNRRHQLRRERSGRSDLYAGDRHALG